MCINAFVVECDTCGEVCEVLGSIPYLVQIINENSNWQKPRFAPNTSKSHLQTKPLGHLKPCIKFAN
jgi:hypothetical protein